MPYASPLKFFHENANLKKPLEVAKPNQVINLMTINKNKTNNNKQ